MAKKKQRRKSPHPGVKLKRKAHRSGAESWVARWVDPLDGTEKSQSMEALGITSREARAVWAVDRSKALKKREAKIASGEELPQAETPLAQAVGDYFAGARLRDSTRQAYERQLVAFVAWARSKRKVRNAQDLTGPVLASYRDHLAGGKRRKLAVGGKPGEREDTDEDAKEITVNTAMARTKPFLNWARRRGLAPALTSDTIKDSLKPLKLPKPLPEILRPVELRALLRACLRHDAAVFALTREEKAAGLTEGRTPRYTPASPFVLALLLGGFRFDEARTLPWAQVALDAPDESGKPVGEIRITTRSKTHAARIVDLAITPGLKKLLGAMRLRTGDARDVFPYTRTLLDSTRRRLVKDYGAPSFTWQTLRRSCGSYAVCAPSVYGGGGPYLTARRLGHAVAVSEKWYLGSLRGLSHDARDLESAMQVGDLCELVIRSVTGELAGRGLSAAVEAVPA